MSEISYGLEKLDVVIDILATHPGRIRERLLDAVISHFHRLQTRNFPHDLQPLYKEIHDSLTSKEPTGNEGGFEATIKNMDEDTAVEIVERIVSLNRRLQVHYQEFGDN